MKKIFMRMVISPKVRGRNMLSTQGTLEIGDVPRSALHDKAIPTLMDRMPRRKRMNRSGRCCLDIHGHAFYDEKIEWDYPMLKTL